MFNTHQSPNIIQVIKSRRMRWVGYVVCMADRRGAYRVLVGRPEGRRPLGDLGIRKDNIKMDLQVVEWEGMDWIGLGLDRDGWWLLVNAVINLQVP
jgi:hypothetical protein